MPPKRIRAGMNRKKNNDKSTVEINTSNQENTSPAETGSSKSAVGKPTGSRKRAPVADNTSEERPSTSVQGPSTSEPQRKAVKKIELVINPPPTGEAVKEPELDYGEGGYYPVNDGQVLNRRYKTQKMLGNGYFATVHLAEDRMTNTLVAVKIVRGDERDQKSAEKEIGFMEKIKEATGSESSHTGSENVVTLLDNFRINGKECVHVAMVFEVLGMDLYSVLYKSNQRKLTLNRIRSFSKDILQGLHFLHTKCKIMHLDLKPENLLVKVDPHNMDLSDPSCNASLKIGDFGQSEYTTDSLAGRVQSCHWRAPEIFLESKITPLADIWSVGCILYEMTTRELLFECLGIDNCQPKPHLSDISELLGPLKMRFFKKYDSNAAILDEVFGEEKVFDKNSEETNLISAKEMMKKNPMTMSEADEICELMRELLMINPGQRLSAKEALKHPFFTEDCSE
ncbi:unnamed protein product [Caenorhabditis brenneri]